MTVKILAIDAASDACSAALIINGKVYEKFQIAPQRHTHLLLPMIDELLSETGMQLSQLDALAYGQGPGSFTGIRLAVGVIQGLAFAHNLPVIPVSNLQALAQAAHEEYQAQTVLVIIDAKMQEVYWGIYELASDSIMCLNGKEHISQPEHVILPSQPAWVGVGSGWLVYDQLLSAKLTSAAQIVIKEEYFPHAAVIARLAAYQYSAGNTVLMEQALPNYLRENVAWKKPDIS